MSSCVVSASAQVQRERVLARPGMTAEEVFDPPQMLAPQKRSARRLHVDAPKAFYAARHQAVDSGQSA